IPFFHLPSVFCCFFFFSSRRRHTRFSRDWSSDVCSSDLASVRATTGSARQLGDLACVEVAPVRVLRWWGSGLGATIVGATGRARSEERRVGKECRARWAADHYRKERE